MSRSMLRQFSSVYIISKNGTNAMLKFVLSQFIPEVNRIHIEFTFTLIYFKYNCFGSTV